MKVITLTPTQYGELEILVDALRNPKSNAGSVKVEVKIDSAKIEYGTEEVKIELNEVG